MPIILGLKLQSQALERDHIFSIQLNQIRLKIVND